MKSPALYCLLLFAFASPPVDAGIISDLSDGTHLWTSTLVPGIPNYDSLLEMTDTFTASGTISFDYEFKHFVPIAGHEFWAKSGAGNISIGSSADLVAYTFDNPLTLPNSDHTAAGNIVGLSVLAGDTFSFLANTLSSQHSLDPTVTLEITNFTFTEASSGGSAVPEPSSLTLLTMGAIALGVCSHRRRKQTGQTKEA
ncbi:PEP-CTERM sorting domain-containing protein [Thalassoglobus polymorphus]|uniref:PEP-CTERM motif protein n=1 Tax=Thalassoglobus polymorphus TaxID=2527994 RepID=A0A517QT34_9PLAN|nr:PEP-CTERM sorting domain-containing protein [Thalassoglobus polymorphus]QDT34805.1 PEP-CTERM motif protein [Thalassoglobus polymorphus]